MLKSFIIHPTKKKLTKVNGLQFSEFECVAQRNTFSPLTGGGKRTARTELFVCVNNIL